MSSAMWRTWVGVCILVVLSCAGAVDAGLIYQYFNDFSFNDMSSESYGHSAVLSEERNPLAEPYLSQVEMDGDGGLEFVGYKGQDAELRYCFPPSDSPARRTVTGIFTLDVSFQDGSGYLICRTSPDGMGWSSPVYLEEGYNAIDLASASGVCYVLLSGNGVVIDNVAVSLYSSPVTIRVPENYATIQGAIDAASHGDVIEVRAGTYKGAGNRGIQFRGKAITVRGASGPQSTIIDCERTHRGFYFHELEGPDSVLSGFTIRSGRAFGSQVPPDLSSWSPGAYSIGAGIYCEFSSPTIDNCVIEDCGADVGGGIGAVGGSPIIADCTIQQCNAGGFGTAGSAGRGGAIGLIGGSDVTISNCRIRDNHAFYSSRGAGLYFHASTVVVTGCTISHNVVDAQGSLLGGGAYCSGTAGDVAFRNCIFSMNTAQQGAAIYAEWTSVDVVNCTIAGNKLTGSSSGAAIVQSNIAGFSLTSSIVWGNTGKSLAGVGSVMYSNVQGGAAGTTNLNADPLFASASGEDYHLRSKHGRYDPWFGLVFDSEHSPCIDAGDPQASVGEEPLPNGNRINMGAYGGTRQAGRSPEHRTYHVNASGGSDYWNSGLTPEEPLATIGKAIEKAVSGDTVLVWPGVYPENLVFQRKAITVQSAADAAVLTTPSGAANAYAASFYHAESSRSVLANFVITGCSGSGIYCSLASPTLKNLTIVGNVGGVQAYEGADPNIINCIVWGNRDYDLFQCGARYSNIGKITTLTKTADNMNTDPLFADPQSGDYHLKSSAGRYVPSLDAWVKDTETSPCIDAGDPREAPRGERMPNGGRVNMGAYGGTPYASKSP